MLKWYRGLVGIAIVVMLGIFWRQTSVEGYYAGSCSGGGTVSLYDSTQYAFWYLGIPFRGTGVEIVANKYGTCRSATTLSYYYGRLSSNGSSACNNVTAWTGIGTSTQIDFFRDHIFRDTTTVPDGTDYCIKAATNQTPTYTDTFSIDNTVPVIVAANIATNSGYINNANSGSIVITGYTSSTGDNGSIAYAILTDGTHTISGPATLVGSGFSITVTGWATLNDGVITGSVTVTDQAGNASVTVMTAIKDTVWPIITSVHVSSNATPSTGATLGNIISVYFTYDQTGYGAPGVTIDGSGIPNGNIVHLTGANRRADYTGNAGSPIGYVFFSIGSISDAAGNYGTGAGAVTDGSSVYFTKIVPTLTGIFLTSNNATTSGYAKLGDILTLVFTGSMPLTGVSVTLGGNNISPSTGYASVVLDITNIHTQVLPPQGPVTFYINYYSLSGVAGVPVTGTTNGSGIIYDSIAPIITQVTAPVGGQNRVDYSVSVPEQTVLTYTGFGPSSVISNGAIDSWTNALYVMSLIAGTYSSANIIPSDRAGNIGPVYSLPAFTVTDINATINPNNGGGGSRSSGGGSSGGWSTTSSTPSTHVSLPATITQNPMDTLLNKIAAVKPDLVARIRAILIAKGLMTATPTISKPSVITTVTPTVKVTPPTTGKTTVPTTGKVLTLPVNFQFTQSYSLGDSSDGVGYLQNILTLQGLYTGSISKKFDKATMAALYQFQLTHKILTSTAPAKLQGYLGKATLKALNTAVTQPNTSK